jgi:general nucleoside transport system permease protein
MSVAPDLAFLTTWLSASVRLSGPLLLAALGEVYAERSGVVNVGVEGTILIGALASYLAALMTGSPALGILAAAVAALMASLFLAFFYVVVQASQVVIGIVFNLLALGLASVIYRAATGDTPKLASAPMIDPVSIPGLADLPLIGPVLFQQSPMLYATLALAVLAGVILYRTRFGLNLRAVGENPRAAAAAGLRIARMRLIGVLVSGLGAGLAGAYLILCQIGLFRETISAGRGFIALAIVILGRWNPFAAIAAAFAFGAADALGLSMQLLSLPFPPQLFIALPYFMTAVAISGLFGRARSPAALMQPYHEE